LEVLLTGGGTIAGTCQSVIEAKMAMDDGARRAPLNTGGEFPVSTRNF
jgi:hypothetical protein